MIGFTVNATPYGPAAGDLLASQVHSAKAGDPLAPVTVVVPATYAGVSARRRLAADGVAAVTLLTVQRLAERLAGPALAAAGRRPAPPALVAAAVRRVLAEHPGVFRPVAAHPATEDALVAVHAELRGASERALDALAARSRRTADIVAIHRAVQALLTPLWHDEHDLIAAAVAACGDEHVVRGLGAVIVHLPRRVAPPTADLLGALASRAAVTVNVGLTGDADADAPLRGALARAGVAVPEAAWGPPCAAAIISTSDADEEVRAAVRAIVGAARDGMAFARMAIVWGAAEPYARALDAQLESAGIPHNGTPVRTLATSVAGRTVLALLALPDRRFRRSDVMAALAGAPVMGAGRLVPVRAWERVSREAGVVDGDDWDRLLSAHAARLEARADEALAEERDALAAHLRGDARHARGLRSFVGRLQSQLAGLAAAPTWTELSARTSSLVSSLLGGTEGREWWPDTERHAADRVDVAVEGLGGLDAIGGPAPDVAVFRRSLGASLGAALRRTGRFGEGVLVGPLSVVTGLDLDHVVVLGLAEGTLPPARIEDSLLPDGDRAATAGELPLLADAEREERHRFLAAIAAARHATLCFPRGDLRRPGERVASRWLLDMAAQLAGRSGVVTEDLPSLPEVVEVPSFAGGIGGAAFAATEQEHNLQLLMAGRMAALDRDAAFVTGATMARARASDDFTRFDGNLSGAGVERPSAAVATSATRLETFASCPFRYFAEVVLGVNVPDNPERSFQMGALDKGSLVHEVLDQFVRGVVNGEPGDAGRLAAIAESVFADYEARGATGRAIFWRRDRAQLLRDLSELLAQDQVRGGTPLSSELRFGPPHPVRLALGDGKEIAFRGAVDRVDRARTGGLVVIDYKTGSARRYVGLGDADPTLGGRRFQLAVYALAARALAGRPDAPVEAAYWFVTSKGGFQWIGYHLTEDVLARVREALMRVDALIGRGVFPPVPTAELYVPYVECPFCDPDGLGPGERRRDWERKRSDPALAGLRELLGDV